MVYMYDPTPPTLCFEAPLDIFAGWEGEALSASCKPSQTGAGAVLRPVGQGQVTPPSRGKKTRLFVRMPGASLNPVLEKLEQAEKKEHQAEGQRKPWYIIDPRSSSAIGYWDLLTSFALVFTAIVTPFEVAYLNPPSGNRWEDPLFLCNRIIDLVFISDMAIQFFLGFSRSNSSQGMIWVFDHKQIVLHYLSSFWFSLDFISITSSIPDIAEIKGVEDLTILRIIRVIRLIKLVRVLRGSRLFKRWEIRFSIDYAMLSLSSSMGSIGLTCHWFACIWGLQARSLPPCTLPTLPLEPTRHLHCPSSVRPPRRAVHRTSYIRRAKPAQSPPISSPRAQALADR